MKARYLIALSCALACLFTGCESPKTVDYDSAMLGKMRSYKCYTVESREERTSYQHVSLTEIVDRRIVTAIKSQLKVRGYRDDCPEPDFIVTFFTKTEKKTKVNDLGMAGGYYRRYPYRGYYGGASRYSIDEYQEGTLIVDIIDHETKQMVWRGAASRRLGRQAPQQAEIHDIVVDILAEFPPQ